MNLQNIPQIDESNIHALLKEIETNVIPSLSQQDALRTILNLIDLTTLEGSDTDEKVINLCKKAIGFKNNAKNIPAVAAVCVYPTLVKIAKSALQGSGLPVASVAGAFPSGQSPLPLRVEEVKYAVNEGADEIDMVISRGKFLEKNFQFIFNEVAAIKAACGKAHLKVILETGELQNLSNIRHASDIAIAAGADFIKTSTGKTNPPATPEAVIVMCQAIKDHYDKTGKMIGIKPSGGIAEPAQALIYFAIVKKILGEKWLNNQWFRIGASRLADKINEALTK